MLARLVSRCHDRAYLGDARALLRAAADGARARRRRPLRRPARAASPRRAPARACARPSSAARVRREAAGGGRRQGRAASSCAATRKSRSSRPTRATSCTPSGSPSALQCSGSEIAGWPVTLKGSVKAMCGPRRSSSSKGRSPSAELREQRRRLAHGRREQQVEAAGPPGRHARRPALLPLGGLEEVLGRDRGALRIRDAPQERLDVVGSAPGARAVCASPRRHMRYSSVPSTQVRSPRSSSKSAGGPCGSTRWPSDSSRRADALPPPRGTRGARRAPGARVSSPTRSGPGSAPSSSA